MLSERKEERTIKVEERLRRSAKQCSATAPPTTDRKKKEDQKEE